VLKKFNKSLSVPSTGFLGADYKEKKIRVFFLQILRIQVVHWA